MTSPRRVTARTVLAALAVTVTLMAFPVAASAHTTLISQSPKAGATVRSPEAIKLTFADRVIQPGVVVRGGDGQRVKSTTSVDGPKVTARLPKHLTPGRYQVGWRVVAPDGHVQTGQFRFAVPDSSGKVPSSASPGASSASGGGPPVWLWVAIAGVVVLAGGGLVAVRRALR